MIFFSKEGFITVAVCWVASSLVGAVPFGISGAIPSFTDALFEIVSGFTTTGASIRNRCCSGGRFPIGSAEWAL